MPEVPGKFSDIAEALQHSFGEPVAAAAGEGECFHHHRIDLLLDIVAQHGADIVISVAGLAHHIVTDLARRLHRPLCPATLYVAIRYREVRKFLAGAFFVSSGMLLHFWVTGTSLPIVLPYVGTITVESPEISGQRAIVGHPMSFAALSTFIGTPLALGSWWTLLLLPILVLALVGHFLN